MKAKYFLLVSALCMLGTVTNVILGAAGWASALSFLSGVNLTIFVTENYYEDSEP